MGWDISKWQPSDQGCLLAHYEVGGFGSGIGRDQNFKVFTIYDQSPFGRDLLTAGEIYRPAYTDLSQSGGSGGTVDFGDNQFLFHDDGAYFLGGGNGVITYFLVIDTSTRAQTLSWLNEGNKDNLNLRFSPFACGSTVSSEATTTDDVCTILIDENGRKAADYKQYGDGSFISGLNVYCLRWTIHTNGTYHFLGGSVNGNEFTGQRHLAGGTRYNGFQGAFNADSADFWDAKGNTFTLNGWYNSNGVNPNSGVTTKFGACLIMRDCSRAHQQLTEAYLAHRFGIEDKLAPGHPYRTALPTADRTLTDPHWDNVELYTQFNGTGRDYCNDVKQGPYGFRFSQEYQGTPAENEAAPLPSTPLINDRPLKSGDGGLDLSLERVDANGPLLSNYYPLVASSASVGLNDQFPSQQDDAVTAPRTTQQWTVEFTLHQEFGETTSFFSNANRMIDVMSCGFMEIKRSVSNGRIEVRTRTFPGGPIKNYLVRPEIYADATEVNNPTVPVQIPEDIAIVRDGDQIYLFVDGKLIEQQLIADADNWDARFYYWTGTENTGSRGGFVFRSDFDDWNQSEQQTDPRVYYASNRFDDFRYTRGVARYTSDYEPRLRVFAPKQLTVESQPVDVINAIGDNAVFTCAASSPNEGMTVSYQWFSTITNAAVAGANTSTLTVTNSQFRYPYEGYFCQVTDGIATNRSSTAFRYTQPEQIQAISRTPSPLYPAAPRVIATMIQGGVMPSPLYAAKVATQSFSVQASVPSPLNAAKAVTLVDLTAFTTGEKYTAEVTLSDSSTVMVPISSWQATLQAGTSNFVQIVVPAVSDYADALNDAVSVRVFKAEVTPQGLEVNYTVASATDLSVSFARGPSRYTATIRGYSEGFPVIDENTPEPNAATDRDLVGVRTVRSGAEGTRVRCKIDTVVKPGLRVWYSDTDNFIATYVNFYANAQDAYMDIGDR